jgi:agmatine deiminase
MSDQPNDSESNDNAMTPAAQSYRWPAEWERHAATWIAWPHNPETWPGTLERIPPVFAQWARQIAEFESVRLLAGKGETLEQARKFLGDLPQIEFIDLKTNDAWVRDYGPLFLVKAGGGKAVVNWQYNAWGGKYPPFDLDNAVPVEVARRYGLPCFEPGIVLEGGSIEGNGAGVLLTTESCLLNPSRNGAMGRGELERYLWDFLAVESICWLAGGDFAGDDTDGHIDQLVRFVDPQTVVAATCTDTLDENFEVLQFLYQQLQALRLPSGEPLNIELLPIPQAKFCQGRRLPASYCNFSLHNGGAIVPQFDDPADDIALERLAALFPDRRVVGLPALDLIWGLGAFHCLSQQEPSSDPASD